jgi:hypothetical protein
MTPEEVLVDIREVSRKHSRIQGAGCTLIIYRQWGKYSWTSVRKFFKSWNRAVEKAGLLVLYPKTPSRFNGDWISRIVGSDLE